MCKRVSQKAPGEKKRERNMYIYIYISIYILVYTNGKHSLEKLQWGTDML